MDQFADTVSLTLNGKKSHGTRIGGCLTILVYFTVFVYWVWGTVHCFLYYQPQVITTNWSAPDLQETNLNL